MSEVLKEGFKLGDRVVFPRDGRIEGPDGAVHVEPRYMSVLLCLAAKAGEAVEREALVQTVWGHSAVTDDALNRSISKLRIYLGDNPRSPTFVETLPKLGYRLVAPVTPLGDDSETAAMSPGDADQLEPAPTRGSRKSLVFQLIAGTLAGIAGAVVVALMLRQDPVDLIPVEYDPPPNSIAVMPFEEIPDNNDPSYLGDGFSEDLQTALSRADKFLVVSRSSTLQARDVSIDPRDVGRILNVSLVLMGTVRIQDGILSVTPRLVDSENGYQIWADTFEGELRDVYRVQNRVVTAVIGELGEQALEARDGQSQSVPTETFDAYSFYIRGRRYLRERTPESISLAREYFEQATKLDPNFALAYAGLSDAWIFAYLYAGERVEDVLELARPALEKALELGDGVAEVHAAEGQYLHFAGTEPGAARRAWAKALALDPNNPELLRMFAMSHEFGYFEGASAHLKLATTIDPLNQPVIARYVDLLMNIGRVQEAKSMWESLAPEIDRSALLLRTAGSWISAYGDPVAGLNWLNQAVDKDPNGPVTLTTMAQVYLQLGMPEQAQRWLDRAKDVAPDSINTIAWQSKTFAFTGNSAANYALLDVRLDEYASGDDSLWRFPKFWYILYGSIADIQDGNYERAVTRLDDIKNVADNYVLTVGSLTRLEIQLFLTCAVQKNGDKSKATSELETGLKMLEDMRSDGWDLPQLHHIAARFLALSGDIDGAFATLDSQLQLGLTTSRRGSWMGFWSLGFDPTLDNLRGDKRFDQLLARVEEMSAISRRAIDEQSR